MTHAAPDCPSSGHQRAITSVRRHFFGDLVVSKRVNLIGYVQHENDSLVRGLPVPARLGLQCNNVSIDDLDQANSLGNVNIQLPLTSTSTTSPSIKIGAAGTQVPQDALVKMTSRSVFYLDRLD